jgi:CDP-diacylglycerol--serine O-phosphatidyltransferase
MIYTKYLPDEPTTLTRLGAVLAIFYVICAALRLARFNVFQADMRDYFIGLPSPAAAGTLASFVLFMQYFEWVDAMWYGLGPFTIALSLLMVSSVPYPKSRMKAWLYGPRKGFSFLVLVGVAIAVIDQASHFSPSIVLFPMALLYLAAGPLELAYNQVVTTRESAKLPGAAERDEKRPHVKGEGGYPDASEPR